MKIITVLFLSAAMLSTVCGQRLVRGGRLLIVEAQVLQIGKSPKVSCGVTAPYRIAKYRISRVLQGNLDDNEIIVHHLFCDASVLEDISVGDKVLIVIDQRRPPAQISWDGEILRKGMNLKHYYSAVRVARLTACCDF